MHQVQITLHSSLSRHLRVVDKRPPSSTARRHITSCHILQTLDDRGLPTPVLAEDEGEGVVELNVLPILQVRAEGSDSLHLIRHLSLCN